jgi:DNA (cytosine-5)-methyltransferase 1
LKTNSFPLQLPSKNGRKSLDALLEKFDAAHSIWWSKDKTNDVKSSLSLLQSRRLDLMIQRSKITKATAYRRTRLGKAVWEIRADDLSGCLRTARGGSSKQAVVEAGNGHFRIRWMTAKEYAALQGVEDFFIDGVAESKALFGFGDAVCVPAISWIIKNYLLHELDKDALSTNAPEVTNDSKNETRIAHSA